MNVRIYDGHKSAPISIRILIDRFADFNIKATPIDQHEINNTNSWLHETDLLVFTAGSVTEFKNTLGPKGIERIQNYVREHGGMALGFCAGAYFFSKIIDFTGVGLNKRTAGLGFFNVLARGSLESLTGRPYNGNSDSAAAISVFYDNAQRHASIYWGGPQFLVMEKNTNLKPFGWTRARHTGDVHLMGIHGPVGEGGGYAFMLGHHPEINDQNFPRFLERYSGGTSHDERIFREFEQARQNTSLDGFDFLIREITTVRDKRASPQPA